jgi:hypothetical protein
MESPPREAARQVKHLIELNLLIPQRHFDNVQVLGLHSDNYDS